MLTIFLQDNILTIYNNKIYAYINTNMNTLSSELDIVLKTGNIDEIKRLVRLGADIEGKDENGKAPLHWATLYGKTKAIAELVRLGADIEAKDENVKTPLHWASISGNIEVITVLPMSYL